MSSMKSTAAGKSQYTPAVLHLNDFQKIVGDDGVLYADESSISSGLLDKYVVDWTRKYRGMNNVIAFPRSTSMVSELLAFCNTHSIAVVPQGGNTGLVGGAVGLASADGGAGGGELILSLEKMNAIVEIDAQEAVLVAEAGCILEILSNAAEEHGLLVPLDLGAKGSCMIGGNVSTNAGGLRVIRYGSLNANVLGLEVVLADGTVLNMLRHLPKDNCGYPLKHLFIGAEGTLGVVTKVAIALAPLPVTTTVALVRMSSFDAVGWLLRETQKSSLSTSLSAFEFMDATSLSCMVHACPGVLSKVGAPSVMALSAVGPGTGTDRARDRGIAGEVLVLMEFSSGGREGSSSESSAEASTSSRMVSTGQEGDGNVVATTVQLNDTIDQFLATLLSRDGDGDVSSSSSTAVLDAVISQNRGQETALWAVREHLPVGLMQLSRGTGARSQLFKYDISMKLTSMDSVVLAVKKQLQREGYHIADDVADVLGDASTKEPCSLLFCNFGHAGDKNLHLNVIAVVRHDPVTISAPSASTVTVPVAAAPGDASLERVRVALDRAVCKAVLSVSGSISAEHGVGQKNRAVMPAARSVAELRLMSAIKRTLDPNNILNPRKVIPDGY